MLVFLCLVRQLQMTPVLFLVGVQVSTHLLCRYVYVVSRFWLWAGQRLSAVSVDRPSPIDVFVLSDKMF